MSEARTCKNCQSSFTIEPDDVTFYAKLKVPAPTLCPECRKQRRLAWRNDMTLYTRTCDLCKKSIVSIHSPNKSMTVYCVKCWWSDQWDPKSYAKPYDPQRSFLEQMNELQWSVPALALMNDDGIGSVNSAYTQDFARAKNCYMCFIGWKVEDCMYSIYVTEGREIYDSVSSLGNCETIYDTFFAEKCYRSKYVYCSETLVECMFCYDCRDSSDCFMSTGLRHKRYNFKNQQYTKEEYEKIVASYQLNTYAGVQRARAEFNQLLLQYPRRFAYFWNCVECTGDLLINGKNSKNCFNLQRATDCRYMENGDTPTESYDLSIGGELSQCYEGITPDHSNQSRFSIFSWKNQDVDYVDACHASKDLFGCVGLRKAQYCILNTQYTKEEYGALRTKIIEDMKDSYGEFFPARLSYFGYNETVAQQEYPLTKAQALERGYSWQDELQMTTGKETLLSSDIPDAIEDVQDTIIDAILACADCKRNYKITPNELGVYRRLKISIPRQCFFCRLGQRLLMRNPNKLWHRSCMCAQSHPQHTGQCPNEFETSYAPDRPEIVYCESCYQQEVV